MVKNKVIVIVDGSNLFHRLKELNFKNRLEFDYSGLVEYLTKEQKLISKTYYVGKIRAKDNDKKGQKLRKNQQRLTAKLMSGKWQVYFGYLLKSGGKYHEKGVDVKMAMDVLVGAYENKYDSVYLISSDTDLLPVIDKVKSMKKKVVYVGFSHKPSYALIKHSSEVVLLRAEEVKKFVNKKKSR